MEYIFPVLIFFALIFDRLNIFFFLLVSSVLHEAGHIAACILCNSKPRISASVFGFKLSRYPDEKNKKLFVLISGPSVNLVLIIVVSLLLKDGFSLQKYIFLNINFIIFVFNMLPVDFLDGGQIIRIFTQNTKMLKFIDIASIITVVMSSVCFSGNKLHSLAAVALFITYYIINKLNLR